MSPKEKAKELYNTFYNIAYHPSVKVIRKTNAKQCALIAIDEILISIPCAPFCISTDSGSSEALIDANNFWNEVKKEIDNL